MVAAIFFASLASQLPEPHGHPVGCSCQMLPKYDRAAGLIASLQPSDDPDSLAIEANPKETNLANVRQLTFGGQNAEAYWSVDGKKLVYQSRQPQFPDEQIFMMNADGSGKTLVSTGLGRTTCSYFTPDQRWIYFSSTHERNEGAQKPVDMSKGYVWMVNPEFALYRVRTAEVRKGTAKPETVIKLGGYVAETTIAPNSRFMTLTLDQNGDLDIYRANLDGSNLKQLTDEVGYDGGPFVSWCSKYIVYRRDKIDNDAELKDYKELHAQHLVRPSKLEIWIMDADGKNKRQLTQLNAASFAPFLHPNGKSVIFSTNYGDPRGREFDLWMVDVDGTNLRRITHTPDFDGFPMFSRDGKKLVWAANRNGKVRGETNIFVADWKE
jgi:Tol biopolymer transport system component